MFQVTYPSRELRSQADDARRQLVGARTELLHSLGSRLVRLVQASFMRRSRGETDAGITWEPLTSARLKAKHRQGLPTGIGIASGELYRSAGYQIQGDGLFVEFNALHANIFGQKRPLMPEEMPDDWQAELESLAEEWGDEILIESFAPSGDF
jgi:hypothetical protein